jgi:hypothetical protein
MRNPLTNQQILKKVFTEQLELENSKFAILKSESDKSGFNHENSNYTTKV